MSNKIGSDLALKRSGGEGDSFTPSALIKDYVEGLAQRALEAPKVAAQKSNVDLDAVFRNALREAW